MGLSHIYRIVCEMRPELAMKPARDYALYLVSMGDIRPIGNLTERDFHGIPFKTGAATVTFDIEAYGGWDKSAWPIDGDAPNRQLQAYHSRFGLHHYGLGRAQAERRPVIDTLVGERLHQKWMQYNGLAPSDRERFERLLTSMTTSEALDFMSEQKRREILGNPFGAHTLATGADCPEDCACCIYVGQLSYCKVCKGGESSLPSECPGVAMTDEQQRYVTYDTLDFKNGEWVKARKPAQ